MSTLYSIDYTRAKRLRGLAQGGAEEAAIDRLEEFRGDADDVRTAAALYQRAGDGANAADLLRMLPPEEKAPARDPRLHALALGVTERLTSHGRQRIEAAIESVDAGDVGAIALRNDYTAVYDALTEAVSPLEGELKRLKIGAFNDATEVSELRGEIRALNAALRELREVFKGNGGSHG